MRFNYFHFLMYDLLTFMDFYVQDMTQAQIAADGFNIQILQHYALFKDLCDSLEEYFKAVQSNSIKQENLKTEEEKMKRLISETLGKALSHEFYIP